VIIAFHGDADGICSAALLAIWAREKGKKIKLISPRSVTLPEIRATEVYVLDIGKKAEIRARKVVWIDHHEPFEPEPGWDYINPRVWGRNRPTSLLVHEKFGGPSWIAYIGAVSDAYRPSIKVEYPPALLRGLIPILNASRAYGKQVKAVKLLMKNDPKFIIDRELVSVYNRVEEEVMEILKNPPKKMGPFVLLEFESEHYISNYVAGKLKRIYGGIGVAANRYKGTYEVEMRTDLGVDLRELVKPWGGGHEKAAGATIPEESWREFLNRLKNFGNSFKG